MTNASTGVVTPTRGKITAVLGPTNTGKTHYAIERMTGHPSGMIGLPLRLLAREVYERLIEQKPKDQVALLTGEEKILPEDARYFVCTVESMPLDKEVSFLAVDEIQLCADFERGHVFTDRLLHARGTHETLFLGSETMRGIIRTLLPNATFLTRTRFSELTHSGSRKLAKLPRRSALVAFSAENVYGIAELVRRQRGGAAVVMGALSPRTRNAQVELYQSGDVDYLVATDAIGMGLNMDVDHVALASLRKFDGSAMRPLRAHELGQIAGRAGRYKTDGTFGTTGDANDLDPEIVEQIETHRFDPVRMIQWRNRDLDFGGIEKLIESLEAAPPVKGLVRARAASDLAALQLMGQDSVIAASVDSEADLKRLWSVCQVPDFRNITTEEHVNLLTSIYKHLLDNSGRLPEDWLKGQVDRLDNTEGDIEMLAGRIANIRTWTFVSNRADWLDDAAGWQERTREVEDKLSDALHEVLTQRFVDKRTSVLLKSLHLNEDLMSEISAEGEVTVEGHYVGRLQGFIFVADPRAAGQDGKALRAAAAKALRVMISTRAEQLVAARDELIELSDHGRLRWNGDPVARLTPSTDGLAPKITLLADDLLESPQREAVETRLQKWLDAHIHKNLAPLVDLRDAASAKTGNGSGEDAAPDPIVGGVVPLTGLARGIGYQLVEGFAVLDRRKVADQLRDLDQDGRAQLRRFGVRFGQYSVFLPALLKPAPARLLVILWAVQNDRFSAREDDPEFQPPAPPPPGLCSVPIDPGFPEGFYGAAGFRTCGARAVRVDMLERLGDMIRSARTGEADKRKKQKGPKAPAVKPSEATPAAEAPKPEETPAEAEPTPVVEAVESTATPADSAAAPEAPSEAAETIPPAPDAQSAEAPIVEATSEEAPAVEETKTEDAPQTAKAEEEPAAEEPKKKIPDGSFEITADMMSIVGCSGDDFEAILRSVGYRRQTLPAEGEGLEPLTVWRQQTKRDRQGPPRGRQGDAPRKEGRGAPGGGKRPRTESDTQGRPPRNKKGKPGGKPQDGQRHGRPPQSKPYQGKPKRREKEPDPDSPFAVLAALKAGNK